MMSPGDVGGQVVPAVRIRVALPEDLPEVCAIEAKAFTNPWHPHTFRSLLTRDEVHVFVAEASGEGITGYAVVWWVMDQGELANLAVRGDCQGRGMGSALLDRVLDEARKGGVESLFLEVRVSNERAKSLYLRRGFVHVGMRKDYYRNPREDAEILCKFLGERTPSNP